MATLNPPTTKRPSPRPAAEPVPRDTAREPGEERVAATSRPASYAPAVIALCAAVAVLAVHAPTTASIVAIWIRSETFAHGFIVVPLCLWLAWRERERLAALKPRAWWPALLAVAGAGFVWLVAWLADVLGVAQFALAFMVLGSIVAVIGPEVARAAVFPLLFLLFAVPAGEFLTPTLIDRTADFTVGALRATGVPVFREANHFVIPSGSWSIVEACSGLRYLIASVMVGTIYAVLTYRSAWRRFAFIAASVAVPVVANWLRAFGIVMLGHLSDNRIAVGVDHLIYGWVFFGVVMALLFWVGTFWHEDEAPGADRPATAAVRHESLAAAPRRPLIVMAVAAVALAAFWRPLEAGLQQRVNASTPQLATVAASGDWTASAREPTPWRPSYGGFAAEHTQAFARGDREVGLYIAYYRNQRPGRELVTSANEFVRKDEWRWKLIAEAPAVVDWAGTPVEVSVARISGLRHGVEAVRLYWVSGHLTDSPYVAKALTAWTKLKGGGDDSALLVVYTRSDPAESARRVLLEFVRANSPAIDRMLAQAREEGR